MKPKYLIGALAFLALACSADSHSVDMVGSPLLKADCTLANVDIERGLLDLSVSPNYVLGVRYVNNAQVSTTTVGGQLVQTANNTFYGKQVVFDYTSDPPANWAEETEQYLIPMPAGSSGNNAFFTLDLVQPKALAQLQGMTLPATGITLNVTFQVKGDWEDGASGSTNKLTYPITVLKSGFAGCPVGKVEAGAQVCGNFQDGPVFCADAGS